MIFSGARRLGALLAFGLASGAGGAAAPSGRSSTSAAHLYWANVNGTIVEANLNGTRVKTIAKGQSTPYAGLRSGPSPAWRGHRLTVRGRRHLTDRGAC